jgi:hypothetical protein
MKYLFVLIIPIIVAGACTRKNEEGARPGDFVFYRYEVYAGDSLVFSTAMDPSDTAETFVEDPELHSGNIFQQALMRQLPGLSSGDSLNFSLKNGLEGRLWVYRLINKEEYPKYIEEGDKLRAAFEARLEVIKKEMEELEPEFEKRAKSVADSTLDLSQKWRNGELDWAEFEPGIGYYMLREGNGPLAKKSSSWTWIHFCALSNEGKLILNTYESQPVVFNRRGALMAPWIEKTVIQFPEGSQVLLKIPKTLAMESDGLPEHAETTNIFVLLEILRTNNMY